MVGGAIPESMPSNPWGASQQAEPLHGLPPGSYTVWAIVLTSFSDVQ